MGTYFWPVCPKRGEMLDSPYAAKDREWAHHRNPSSNILAWAMTREWNGQEVIMIHDAGGFDELESAPFRNIWNDVARDYLKVFGPLDVSCVAWRDGDETVCLCVKCARPTPKEEP